MSSQGTLLLQVPPAPAWRVVIHTAAITASITGTTIMLEYIPKKDLKVAVLEGSLKLSAPGFLGDSITLHAGQMIIMPPSAREDSGIPSPSVSG